MSGVPKSSTTCVAGVASGAEALKVEQKLSVPTPVTGDLFLLTGLECKLHSGHNKLGSISELLSGHFMIATGTKGAKYGCDQVHVTMFPTMNNRSWCWQSR